LGKLPEQVQAGRFGQHSQRSRGGFEQLLVGVDRREQ
jgi:hypothetical protein